ncbi:hypothetical protein AVEN_41960-1 [Araneus ventricosus]|uniref:Uncharacterized protein n=1 Tax=Araneus ventricosus TaxID=182803 RepID=A0A4Y2TI04_ARAVE|nr:hypothetical protein AVEN_41960-1 [Araneus ventricosus]
MISVDSLSMSQKWVGQKGSRVSSALSVILSSARRCETRFKPSIVKSFLEAKSNSGNFLLFLRLTKTTMKYPQELRIYTTPNEFLLGSKNVYQETEEIPHFSLVTR